MIVAEEVSIYYYVMHQMLHSFLSHKNENVFLCSINGFITITHKGFIPLAIGARGKQGIQSFSSTFFAEFFAEF